MIYPEDIEKFRNDLKLGQQFYTEESTERTDGKIQAIKRKYTVVKKLKRFAICKRKVRGAILTQCFLYIDLMIDNTIKFAWEEL